MERSSLSADRLAAALWTGALARGLSSGSTEFTLPVNLGSGPFTANASSASAVRSGNTTKTANTRRNAKKGIASLRIGDGIGAAMTVER
jgi:hypothetical protein